MLPSFRLFCAWVVADAVPRRAALAREGLPRVAFGLLLDEPVPGIFRDAPLLSGGADARLRADLRCHVGGSMGPGKGPLQGKTEARGADAATRRPWGTAGLPRSA